MRRQRRSSRILVGVVGLLDILVLLAFVLATVGPMGFCPTRTACERPCCPRPAPAGAAAVLTVPCCGQVVAAPEHAAPVAAAPDSGQVRAPALAIAVERVLEPVAVPHVRRARDLAARPPPDPLFLRHRSLLL